MASKRYLILPALLVVGAAHLGAAIPGGLWPRLSRETALPGGIVQIKMDLTEPKPIIKSRFDMDFNLEMVDDIIGVSVYSADSGVYGIATVENGRLHVECVSPTGEWGMEEYAPILTITLRLKETAEPGTQVPINVDLSTATFWDPDGNPYLYEVIPGRITVGGELSIENIIPSGGEIRGGQALRVMGRGFQPGAEATIAGLPEVQTLYVSPTELRVTAPVSYALDGRRVRVKNPDAAEKLYYAFLRSVSEAPSRNAKLADAFPLFSPKTSLYAMVAAEGGGTLTGVAFENPGPRNGYVILALVDARGDTRGVATASLAPMVRTMRDLSEWFPGVTPPAGARVRVWSFAPIRILGLELSADGNVVTPLVAEDCTNRYCTAEQGQNR